MEDIELSWKRQLKLEKTEILSYHKLGGILFAQPPHPSHQVGCSQEQDQLTVVFPNLFHFMAQREHDDACVELAGKQKVKGPPVPTLLPSTPRHPCNLLLHPEHQ